MENRASKNIFLIVLILLLIGVTVLYTVQYIKTANQEKLLAKVTLEKETILTEKDSIQHDFSKLLADFNGLKTNNSDLNNEVETQKKEIQNYLKKIKFLDKDSKDLIYFKIKIKEFQLSRDYFVSQIDSLTLVNQALKTENSSIKSEIALTSGENSKLNEKVSKAEQIKGMNLSISFMNDKSKIQKKAKKVTQIKLCITLVQNELSKSGMRDIFFRVYNPSDSVLFDSPNNLFKYGNKSIEYTAKTTVNYQNEAIDACLPYVIKRTLKSGNYSVEAFSEGHIIGKQSIKLE